MKELKRNFTIQIIIQLSGTSSTISTEVDNFHLYNPNTEFAGLTEDDLDTEYLADVIFLCCTCGWWCEVGECYIVQGENTCEECANTGE